MAVLAVHTPVQVDGRAWRPQVGLLVAVAAAVTGLIVGLWLSVFVPGGAAGGKEYHLWRWEADTLASNVFARLGIGPGTGEDGGDHAIRRYSALTSQVRAALQAGDTRLAGTLTNERSAYENDVERAIERRLDAAIQQTGLQRGLPLFSGVAITWPPVDIELTSPPRLLVRSPRAKIERQGDTLLKSGLTLAEIERLEANSDSDDTVSLIVSIGGLAAYPAIVNDDRSYDSLLETSAHEWVHHYLAFYPLGQKWGSGGDAEPLNETTANIAGRELANIIRREHAVQLPADADGGAPPGPTPTVDFRTELRKLRLEVDALLAGGKVSEAEQLMEERRRYLDENGISIRKLNQAYFAFYGTYADSPASSNPIGPKIERVWELTRDVRTFLSIMRDVTDAAELDRALATLEAASR